MFICDLFRPSRRSARNGEIWGKKPINSITSTSKIIKTEERWRKYRLRHYTRKTKAVRCCSFSNNEGRSKN